ncbi:restriction endonuclease subunit S [Rhizobium leguminosarum]|uniref:restriction endonuclease subunit S n=1 Tax=Rhizobium leguminosarum TaxID=384 RepID=UPI001040572E|nr:restriction endonuclease subunit S [Rhizobium leguminosarum]TBY44917.1 hypothetical protein E0H54_24025 [Rhizobium leguminosarum bv. viciae]
MSTNRVPAGWAELKLSQVAAISSDRFDWEDAASQVYLGLEHIERHTHRIIGHGSGADISSVKNRFRAGDLLYGRLRPNLNKVAIAPFDGICSTDIVVFRPTAMLDTSYLLEILSDDRFIDYAISKAKGVNLPRISVADVLAYSTHIPPYDEQQRIIRELEVRYSLLSTINQKLSDLAEVIQRMPFRIIEAGVQGKLFKGWQSKQRTRVERNSTATVRGRNSSGNLETPLEWKKSTVGSAGDVSAGRQRSPKNHYGENMQPYLRVANVFEDRISVDDIMTMHFEQKEFETYRLRHGDILLNEGQSLELVGRPAMFRNELDPVAFTNSLVRFRASGAVEPEYALLVFRHYLHSGVFRSIAKITTNLAHLGVSRFAALPFPLPPIDQQRDIARISREHLDNIERIRNEASRVESLLGALKKALRKEALAGKLARQISGETDVLTSLSAYEALLAAQPKPSRRRSKPRTSLMKGQIPVSQALKGVDKPIDGQKLFYLCGYPEDSSTDLIEQFFLDLRTQLQAGSILRLERDGHDVFVPQKGEAE